jgi:hypothetical protein
LSNPLYTPGAAAHARYYGRFSLLNTTLSVVIQNGILL